MKTKQKLVKKVIASILTLAIMLNIGLSIKTNGDSYIPEISLTTMGVQAQQESGSSSGSGVVNELQQYWDNNSNGADSLALDANADVYLYKQTDPATGREEIGIGFRANARLTGVGHLAEQVGDYIFGKIEDAWNALFD